MNQSKTVRSSTPVGRKRTGTSVGFAEAQACCYAQGLLEALDGCCGLSPCEASMLVPSDTPQTHFAHVRGALSSEPKRPMGTALRSWLF